jgi:hypothetical protein
MSESPVLKSIFATIGRLATVRIFRNNVGVAFQGKVESEHNGTVVLSNARRIRFGLFKGSHDLIGWASIVITPEMVGKKIARFLSIEAKGEKGKMSEEQKNFMDQVTIAGGVSFDARSEVEALEKLCALCGCEISGMHGKYCSRHASGMES